MLEVAVPRERHEKVRRGKQHRAGERRTGDELENEGMATCGRCRGCDSPVGVSELSSIAGAKREARVSRRETWE